MGAGMSRERSRREWYDPRGKPPRTPYGYIDSDHSVPNLPGSTFPWSVLALSVGVILFIILLAVMVEKAGL
jgi:hypothetical protein